MIGVIDYGVGNIKAFINIYKRLNMPHCIVKDESDFSDVEKLILPGVGSFDHSMSKLNDSGLRQPLEYAVLEKKVPVLGVCVGMQMLANDSEEGELPGLGWIPGVVKKINGTGPSKDFPLPHMGWNTVNAITNHPLFDKLDSEPRFYFLHSYYFSCQDDSCTLATVDYSNRFSCVVYSDNIYGIQCHPEKSHHNGIKFLKNFGEL